MAAIVGTLAGCAGVPLPEPPVAVPPPATVAVPPAPGAPQPPGVVQGKSRWLPVAWSELPPGETLSQPENSKEKEL